MASALCDGCGQSYDSLSMWVGFDEVKRRGIAFCRTCKPPVFPSSVPLERNNIKDAPNTSSQLPPVVQGASLSFKDKRISAANLTRCPNIKRYFRGRRIDLETGEVDTREFYGRCKRWSCPYCAKINQSNFKRRVRDGVVGILEADRRAGYRIAFGVKFLTLTVPGNDWRDQTTKEAAYMEIKKRLKRFLDQLKRRVGKFEYAWAVEPQADGFPHIHILLVGHAIGPKSVFNTINDIWRRQQKMGFTFIKKAGTQSAAKIGAYLAKYMAKEMMAGGKRGKVFSMSSGFNKVERERRKRYSFTVLESGTYVEDESGNIIERVPDREPRWDGTEDLEYFFRVATNEFLPNDDLGWDLERPALKIKKRRMRDV